MIDSTSLALAMRRRAGIPCHRCRATISLDATRIGDMHPRCVDDEAREQHVPTRTVVEQATYRYCMALPGHPVSPHRRG